ncbi:unnamed protein product [Acanthoscelides obtectus]|uniref:Transposase n=1 Tax=Acanthoscelides obtectus TaxID=200917 RepID=A0A9P0NWX5_ACAOB|nr:unnamed protein product [Acanthoscelides obtectus]CAK1666971.1 hypothetical protein AOBTE_LOCUS25585 [Acanthoscelides obtectus]
MHYKAINQALYECFKHKPKTAIKRYFLELNPHLRNRRSVRIRKIAMVTADLTPVYKIHCYIGYKIMISFA